MTRAYDDIDRQLAALPLVPCEELYPAAKVVELDVHPDSRGWLAPAELEQIAGFAAVRTWAIGGVNEDEVRGRHAHYTCNQALWCVRGSARLVLTDGTSRSEIEMAGPSTFVSIPARLWVQLDEFMPGSVMVTLADQPYEPADYRDSITR